MVSKIIRLTTRNNGVRAFISIEIPHPIREEIARLAEPLKGIRGRVSWSGPNNMHMTLKFLGDCTRGRLGAISKKLAAIGARHKPFQIGFEGMGVFPRPAAPKVIWLGIGEGKEPLAQLANDVRSSMESIGFKPETRPFKPHITLGRVKYLTQPYELADAMASVPKISIEPVIADYIYLMRSQLDPKGAVYTVIERLSLSGTTESTPPSDAEGQIASRLEASAK